MVQLRKDNKVVKNTDTKKSKKATVKDIKKIVQTFVADDLDIESRSI
jgi:hypothetical protein